MEAFTLCQRVLSGYDACVCRFLNIAGATSGFPFL